MNILWTNPGVMKADKYYVILFYGMRCPPCKTLKDYLFVQDNGAAAQWLMKELNCAFYMVDAQQQENIELCQAIKLRSIPHFGVFKGRKALGSFQGQRDKQYIYDNIIALLKE